MTDVELWFCLLQLSWIILFIICISLLLKNRKLIKSNQEDCDNFIKALTDCAISFIKQDEETQKIKKFNQDLKNEVKNLTKENTKLFNENTHFCEKMKEKQCNLNKKAKLIYYYQKQYGKFNKWAKKS